MIKYCKRCLYPNTKPQLKFNDDSICYACLWHDKKDLIDWNKREEEFKAIVSIHRKNNEYDCIIPVSGGKDSHYQVYMAKEYALHPLCVNFTPLDLTEIGRKNLDNIKNLGVDVLEFHADPVGYKTIAKYGLIRHGDYQLPEHMGIFSIPFIIADKFNIKLILWGENPQLEYNGNMEGRLSRLNLDWLINNGGFFLNEMNLPLIESSYGMYIPDGSIIPLDSIFLGYYFKWDIFKQLTLAKKLGFNESLITNDGVYDRWENLDTKFTVFHDYFKYLKYGFGRTTDHASIEIRYGRIKRNYGIDLIKRYEGRNPQKYLTEFLDSADINIKEYNSICAKFMNLDIHNDPNFHKFNQ